MEESINEAQLEMESNNLLFKIATYEYFSYVLLATFLSFPLCLLLLHLTSPLTSKTEDQRDLLKISLLKCTTCCGK